ncbi:TPA: DNA-binding protein [Candidatus Poribacteria bacterium]|nr:DNA-binding protein [Candidatus Poribacteria bacterium]
MLQHEKPHIQHYRLQDLNVSAKSVAEFIAFRISADGELMQNIKSIALNNGIVSGMVLMMIGTLKKARIGWYNTEKGEFEVAEYDGGLELTSGSGSISMENDVLVPHIHITIADKNNNAFGGHLFEDTIVKEYIEGTMIHLKDIFMRRIYDERVGASPLSMQKL